jgi:hypothetical protein
MREPSRLPVASSCLAQFRTTVDGPTHHYQGWVRVAIYESGIWMQWEGEDVWYGVTWWEMAHFAQATPPKLREELEWQRDEARRTGLLEAIADAKAHPELWMPTAKPQRAG